MHAQTAQAFTAIQSQFLWFPSTDQPSPLTSNVRSHSEYVTFFSAQNSLSTLGKKKQKNEKLPTTGCVMCICEMWTPFIIMALAAAVNVRIGCKEEELEPEL